MLISVSYFSVFPSFLAIKAQLHLYISTQLTPQCSPTFPSENNRDQQCLNRPPIQDEYSPRETMVYGALFVVVGCCGIKSTFPSMLVSATV